MTDIPTAAPVNLSPIQSRHLLLGLTLASAMEFYTFESLNLVLPDITGTLGVSFDEASWVLTIYTSFLFLGVPLSNWLAGHFGYKRFLLWMIALFALTSVGLGLSPTLRVMLVLRAVQGVAGGGLTVWWRAGIYLVMPRTQRSPSMMRASMGLYLASAAGLLLSGFLTDTVNWRLICVPNIFLAIAAAWLLRAKFPDLPRAESQRLRNTDYPGLALLAVWSLSLQLILSRGHIDDWFGSAFLRFFAVVCATALIAFVKWENSPRNLYPLLDIKLLRNRHVLAAALIGVFTGMILSGSLFVLPQFLRLVDSQTHSATQTGRLLAFYAIAAFSVRPVMTRFVGKFGPRKMIGASILMLISAMLLLYRFLTINTPDWYFLLPLMLYACCLTSLLPSLGVGTVSKLRPEELMDGVSLYMSFRTVGASLGVAFLTIVIERRESLHSSRLYEHLSAVNEMTAGWLNTTAGYLHTYSGMDASRSALASIGLLARRGAHQVEALAYADCFLFMAFVGMIALLLIPLMAPFVPPAHEAPARNSLKPVD